MICIDEEAERCVSMNKKGEIVKKYPKNLLIVDFIGDNYVYLDDEEGRMGVNNSKDEVVIRPKYERLQAINENLYLAGKSDGESVIIDQNGEVVKQLDDYKSVVYYNGVMYAKTGRYKYELLDAEGKLLSQEEFIINDIERLWSPCDLVCESDYFNAEELAKKIAASINDKGMGNLVIASAFNIGKPEDYNYNKSDAHFKDISKFGVNANILSHKGSFLMSIFAGTDIIISQYDEAEGRYIKSFNPKAQIRYIYFYVYPRGNGLAKENLQTSIQISKTLATELKAKGWKTYVESKYGYVLTKGELCVSNWLDEGTYILGIGYKNLLEDENTEKKDLENYDKRIEEILAGE
jgi:hypothetical protein